MKRGFRLSRPADFKRVRRQGRSYAHPFLTLIVLPNEVGKVRVAVAAGRTVGGAVARNRAKRVLRAAIAPRLEGITRGHDIVLIARPGVQETKSAETEAVVKGLLQKAALIEKNR